MIYFTLIMGIFFTVQRPYCHNVIFHFSQINDWTEGKINISRPTLTFDKKQRGFVIINMQITYPMNDQIFLYCPIDF